MSQLPKFSDFAEAPKVLDGQKVKIGSVLDQEITIIGFRFRKSKYGGNVPTCLTVQFENDEGERRVFFTGSGVLIEQFEQYGDHVPFRATLRKIDKFYTLS